MSRIGLDSRLRTDTHSQFFKKYEQIIDDLFEKHLDSYRNYVEKHKNDDISKILFMYNLISTRVKMELEDNIFKNLMEESSNKTDINLKEYCVPRFKNNMKNKYIDFKVNLRNVYVIINNKY